MSGTTTPVGQHAMTYLHFVLTCQHTRADPPAYVEGGRHRTSAVLSVWDPRRVLGRGCVSGDKYGIRAALYLQPQSYRDAPVVGSLATQRQSRTPQSSSV
eukprot:1759848-Rhodomonas_salina.3